MSRWLTVAALAALQVLLLQLPARSAGAQIAPSPLADAIAAYNDLDFDAAATQFRDALAGTGPQRLADLQRVQALMYLGATELFRNRRPAASEAFQQLLISQPRYRPDPVIFPPEIIAGFQEARIGVRATEVAITQGAEFEVPTERLPIMVYAASLHDIRVRITTSLGAPERVVYEGVIGDSLQIGWDGRDASDRPAAPGRYLLRIASRAPTGNTERETQVPLELEHLPPDTLAWPDPPRAADLLPETEVRANGARQFLTGLLGAGVAAGLPALAGAQSTSTLRFIVGGAITGAGIVGMATAARPRPIPANIAANAVTRTAWQGELRRVQAENAERRRVVQVRVQVGRPATVEVR
jgi:hypothetical protein